jgi:hypothetical protein
MFHFAHAALKRFAEGERRHRRQLEPNQPEPRKVTESCPSAHPR